MCVSEVGFVKYYAVAVIHLYRRTRQTMTRTKWCLWLASETAAAAVAPCMCVLSPRCTPLHRFSLQSDFATPHPSSARLHVPSPPSCLIHQDRRFRGFRITTPIARRSPTLSKYRPLQTHGSLPHREVLQLHLRRVAIRSEADHWAPATCPRPQGPELGGHQYGPVLRDIKEGLGGSPRKPIDGGLPTAQTWKCGVRSPEG